MPTAQKIVHSLQLSIHSRTKKDSALTDNREPRTVNSLGFTLIELMIAITIVAVLATIGLVMLQGAQRIARDAKRKSDLEDIKKAFYAYRNATGTFCLTGAGGCVTEDFAVNDASSGFAGSCGVSYCLKNTIGSYLRGSSEAAAGVANACDPKNNNCTSTTYATDYYVRVETVSGEEQLTLSALLEGVDPGANIVGPTSTRTCTKAVGRNYCITE